MLSTCCFVEPVVLLKSVWFFYGKYETIHTCVFNLKTFASAKKHFINKFLLISFSDENKRMTCFLMMTS